MIGCHVDDCLLSCMIAVDCRGSPGGGHFHAFLEFFVFYMSFCRGFSCVFWILHFLHEFWAGIFMYFLNFSFFAWKSALFFHAFFHFRRCFTAFTPGMILRRDSFPAADDVPQKEQERRRMSARRRCRRLSDGQRNIWLKARLNPAVSSQQGENDLSWKNVWIFFAQRCWSSLWQQGCRLPRSL